VTRRAFLWALAAITGFFAGLWPKAGAEAAQSSAVAADVSVASGAWERRCVVDYLKESIASALAPLQYRPFSASLVKSTCEDVLDRQVALGFLPSQQDLNGGGEQPQLKPYHVEVAPLGGSEVPGDVRVDIGLRVFPRMECIALRVEWERAEVRHDPA